MSPQSLKDAAATAWARAREHGPQYLCISTEADPAVDPLDAATAGTPSEMMLWEQPIRATAFAGRGVVLALEPVSGLHRFRETAAALRRLRDDVQHFGPGPPPSLVGGFSFFPRDEWDGFPSGRLVLPELTYRRHGKDAWWYAATAMRAADDPEAVANDLDAKLREAPELGPSPHVNGGVTISPFYRSDDYRALVEAASKAIEAGELDKVVVARSVTAQGRPDVRRLIEVLRAQYPECTTFWFGVPGGDFVGATPELLARVAGGRLHTAAVAGTTGRGQTPAEDAALATELLNDPKELAEHEFVVTQIVESLRAAGVELDYAPARVLSLSGLQHLHTPITGVLPGGASSILDIVGALHPTPAVGGTPGPQAQQWLFTREGLQRGWYAGPVGHVDLRGEGEFWVALRSALLLGDRTQVYAGAGIVSGSDPDAEVAESAMKLRAILDAIRETS